MTTPGDAETTAGPSPEVALAGGRTTPDVVRVGNTVRRPAPQNHSFLTDLFALLDTEGAQVSPRLIGLDDAGRQVLEWVEGVTTTHPSERREGAYAAGARLLRHLHDVTAGSALAGAAECVTHGDPGPYNAVFQDGLPVVFIDWDSAAPGTRLQDLAYLGWTWCVQSQGSVPVQDQARRLADVLRAYGDVGAEDLLDGVASTMQGMADLAGAQLVRHAGDDAVCARWQATRTWATDDLALFMANREVFRQAVHRSSTL